MINKDAINPLALLLATMLFVGCSTTGPKTSQPITDSQAIKSQPTQSKTDQQASEVPDEKKPSAEFEPQTLYDLMLAEVAGKRNRLDIALGNYMKQAHATKDLNIIKRYAAIANYMRAQQATLDAINLWLEATPEDPKAHNLMLTHKVRTRTLDDIEVHFKKVLSNTPDILEYDYLLLQLRKFNEQEQDTMYGILKNLSIEFKDVHTIWFLMAGIKERQKEYDIALSFAENALNIDSDFTPAVLMKVDILGQQGKVKEALSLLKKAAYANPSNKKLRLIYARTLIRNKDYKTAQKEFEKLVDEYPQDAELLMTLAVLSAENKMYDQAENALNRLIALGQRMDDAYFYLGQISESQKDFKKSIESYSEVNKVPLFTQAQLKIAAIYAEMGELDSARKQLQSAGLEDEKHTADYIVRESELIAKYESNQDAFDFLTTQIESHSDSQSIRYARAMVAEKLDLIPILEEDLRSIIKQNPDSAIALNALGYTLADRNLKLDEAQSLIEKAHSLKPEDAAILDSLGWVYFRQGKLDEALKWLEKAYDKMKDPEIIAHYAEALWVKGDKEKARTIFQEGIQQFPEHKALKSLKERIDFSQ